MENTSWKDDLAELHFVMLKEHEIENDNFDTIGSTLTLRTRGCDCCSKEVEINRETVNAAIFEAEVWLDRLRDLKASL
jgi:hypothetical protein